jgi:ubiquitin-activating enzyme E1
MDYELHDRQIRTYGKDAVEKIVSSNVCIIGSSNGLATEIIKNLCLSGINNIYIYDINTNYENNYYSFQNLNNQNKFNNIHFINDISDIDNFNVIITINLPINEMIEFNNIARGNNKKFIGLLSHNISGLLFIDVGKKHIINQIDSNIYESIQILNIDNEGIITCNGHDYQDGDKIKISNLQGTNIEQFNNEFIIQVIDKYKYKLLDFQINLPFKFINGTSDYINQSIEITHNKLSDELVNKSINNNFDENIFEYYLNNTDYSNQFQATISIMGSITASETIKLITHKFMPISQWITWSDNINITNIYDKLKNTQWLIVGSGAIGCELLKNLAFLNVGKITITDPDIIEKSNLTRQFLFKDEHIGQFKSNIASQVIKQMKPSIDIISMNEKVGDDNKIITDNLLSDDNLTGVFNALDNITARKFMDEQCFNYLKPLFESGTMGTKGNTQPVIPFITETYNASNDPPIEKSFPVCTIKNFPNEILHTIHWALEQFEIFNRLPTNFQKWLDSGKKDDIFENTSDGYKDIYDITNKYKIKNYSNCIQFALDLFNDYYYNEINKLLKNFPIDSLTTENTLFWSNGKRQPTPIVFDINNELHIKYIYYTVMLLCHCFQLDDNFRMNDIISDIIYKDNSDNYDITKTIPQIFDKDNINHIEWITLASNLRAINYDIPIQDTTYHKGIAGKIIPAVATTTSLVAGLITLEMIKYVLYKDTENNKIENYKLTFVNLSNNLLESVEPLLSKNITIAGKEFNGWHKFIHNEDCYLEEFKNKYDKIFETNITIITINCSIIYASFMHSTIQKKVLSDIIKNNNPDIDLTKQHVIISISSDDDIELPEIIIKLK